MSDPIPVTTEQTVWKGTVSQLHYAGKWCLVFLLLAAAGATFWFNIPLDPVFIWSGRAALLIVALLVLGWIQLDRSRRKYIVTNRRVSVEFGIVSRTSNEVRVQDIRSMNVRIRGFSGLLGIGTVEFSSAATDDADVIFWNTPGAEKVRDLVRSLQT